jgi:probable selenium-dependent hydroxylase accessory protein YqeC
VSLLEALGLRQGDVVAVAGAGGKTTLLYQAAAQARAAGWRVLVTTTTHMGTLPESVTGPVFIEAEGHPDPALDAALRSFGLATLLGRRIRDDKLEGIAPERVAALAPRAELVLVEADGARQRSLKLPAPHEPVVPAATTLLLVVAALDALGAPLDEAHVHRLERVVAAAGRSIGDAIDEGAMAAVLAHPEGYPARVPAGAALGLFLNKAEDETSLAAAARLAGRLAPPYAFVAAGSARAGRARVLSSPRGDA